MHKTWKEWGILGFALLLAVFFFAAGFSKLLQPEIQMENFVRWGYPPWFVYVTGVIEVAGAGLLLVRRSRLFGVMVLGVTMVVAAWTHFQAGEMAAVPVPLVLLIFTGALGILDRKRSD